MCCYQSVDGIVKCEDREKIRDSLHLAHRDADLAITISDNVDVLYSAGQEPYRLLIMFVDLA